MLESVLPADHWISGGLRDESSSTDSSFQAVSGEPETPASFPFSARPPPPAARGFVDVVSDIWGIQGYALSSSSDSSNLQQEDNHTLPNSNSADRVSRRIELLRALYSGAVDYTTRTPVPTTGAINEGPNHRRCFHCGRKLHRGRECNTCSGRHEPGTAEISFSPLRQLPSSATFFKTETTNDNRQPPPETPWSREIRDRLLDGIPPGREFELHASLELRELLEFTLNTWPRQLDPDQPRPLEASNAPLMLLTRIREATGGCLHNLYLHGVFVKLFDDFQRHAHQAMEKFSEVAGEVQIAREYRRAIANRICSDLEALGTEDVVAVLRGWNKAAGDPAKPILATETILELKTVVSAVNRFQVAANSKPSHRRRQHSSQPHHRWISWLRKAWRRRTCGSIARRNLENIGSDGDDDDDAPFDWTSSRSVAGAGDGDSTTSAIRFAQLQASAAAIREARIAVQSARREVHVMWLQVSVLLTQQGLIMNKAAEQLQNCPTCMVAMPRQLRSEFTRVFLALELLKHIHQMTGILESNTTNTTGQLPPPSEVAVRGSNNTSGGDSEVSSEPVLHRPTVERFELPVLFGVRLVDPPPLPEVERIMAQHIPPESRAWDLAIEARQRIPPPPYHSGIDIFQGFPLFSCCGATAETCSAAVTDLGYYCLDFYRTELFRYQLGQLQRNHGLPLQATRIQCRGFDRDDLLAALTEILSFQSVVTRIKSTIHRADELIEKLNRIVLILKNDSIGVSLPVESDP